MKYEKIIKGKFIERPNRFVAIVETEGKRIKCHVKNTGRCKELFVPDATVYLEDFRNRMGTRKLEFSLIAVEKFTNNGFLTINIDSQAPNKVVKEALESGKIILPEMGSLKLLEAEKTFGNSRLDFYAEDIMNQKAFIEVKGVTLESDGTARFPDAPTQRGVKHINELVKAVEQGYKGYIIFVIQMEGMKVFKPNDEMHPEFGEVLREASKKGVEVLAYGCEADEKSLNISGNIFVELKQI